MHTAHLAVNGTLMRGLELNKNLLDVGATFVREDETDACYRIWSIDDRHPAMLRTPGAGARVALELWDVPASGLARILQNEPPGLAIEMRAELLMIPTGVPRVAIRFGKPDQRWLDRITVAEAEAYAAEGHFGAGSMGPKIEALVNFVKGRPGGRGVITDAPNIERALRGETGTWIAA